MGTIENRGSVIPRDSLNYPSEKPAQNLHVPIMQFFRMSFSVKKLRHKPNPFSLLKVRPEPLYCNGFLIESKA